MNRLAFKQIPWAWLTVIIITLTASTTLLAVRHSIRQRAVDQRLYYEQLLVSARRLKARADKLRKACLADQSRQHLRQEIQRDQHKEQLALSDLRRIAQCLGQSIWLRSVSFNRSKLEVRLDSGDMRALRRLKQRMPHCGVSGQWLSMQRSSSRITARLRVSL